jgi:hypothetical protein
MDQPNRLPEIVEYLRTGQAPPDVPGGTHVHVHHHYAPAPAPPPPPKATVAEQVVPWVMLGLGACIIVTICGLFLAVALVALVLGLLALSVATAVIALLVRYINEGRASARPHNRRNK